MKKYITILGLAAALFTGCSDERVLDKEPLSLITDAQIWQNEDLVNAYLNDLYLNSRFLNTSGQSGFNCGLIGAMGGEFRTMGPWQDPYKASVEKVIDETGAHWQLNYFQGPYYISDRVAEMIFRLETESTLPEEIIKQKIAEGRFLRAFAYFHAVKRYGGVPLIDYRQDFEDLESLQVPRNSEQEIYDFIASEMDAIADDLSVSIDQTSGRPSKWAALALKSRAMTYAGSIGEYGTVQLDGLLGIANPDTYWQAAYDTSKQIIEESGHALYNKGNDKSKNFQDLFLVENNSEVIFSEIFDEGLLRTHSFGELTMPSGFEAVWGSNFPVMYEMVQLFDFADGTSAADVDITRAEGWSSDELFGNRDPRFAASIFYPEADWQGDKVYFHSNTTNHDSSTGWPKAAPNRNKNRTGFHLRKRLDESRQLPTGGLDDTDYIVFRLGEIYLNMAEAAFHLGMTGEALDAINMIRDRAGMPARVGLTWDNIMQERQVELFAEDHRYWDLRRWRTAVETLDGKRLKGLQYVYNQDEGTYTVKFKNAEGKSRIFQERHYYLPFGLARLADAPALVENPGY